MSARPPAAAGRRSRASSPWIRRAAIVVSVLSTVAVLDGPAVAVPAARTAPAPAPRTGPAAAEAPDAASAFLMARLQHRRIEITGERTDSTTTYAQPNGTTSVESFSGPVRVKDAKGAWQPIDTHLVQSGGAIKPKAAAADVALSDGGSGEPLVEVERGRHSLGIGWTGTLPKPELKGSTATYKNAVAGGGDLVVTALKEGFSHSVVLHERPKGPVEYRIPVQASGLRLTETDDKRLRWEDDKSQAKATAPAPVMWDSSYDRASGDAEHIAPVEVDVEQAKDGRGQVMVLKPSQAFLNDPKLTYPVTIDPTDSLMGPVTDTWIQYDDYLTSQRGSTELKSGTYNGAEKARSFLKFNVDKYKGKQILDTDLRLYSTYSSTCSTANSGNQVRRITADWDPSAITWSNQPATTATGAVTSTAAKGYNSSCPAGLVSWDVDAIVQAWADGQPNYGVRIAAVDESDPLTWRRYYSANQTDGAHNAAYEPSLTVNYNTKPGAAVPVAPLSGTSTNDTTPTLTAKATDADGNTVQLSYEIWTSTGTTAVQSGKSAFTASGTNAPWTPATALAPGSYKWRATVSDGTTPNGTWSAWQTFTVDTTKPANTAVSSTAFPAGQWSGTPDAGGDFSGPFTFTPPTGDVKDIQYRLDSGAWTTAATTGTAVTKTLTFKAGAHTVTAHTRDAAGNVSADTAYVFNAGKGAALTTPGDGERPARRTGLMAQGDTSYTGVRYQFRRGETDQWQDVPPAHVRVNSTGAALSAWPVAVSGGKPAPLTWEITTTLPEDGPVDVRAVFSAATTTEASPEVSVTVDRAAGAAPSLPVGPGYVNSLTGDFTLQATDADGAGTAVTRTAYSRDGHAEDDGQVRIFGPEWVSGVYAEITDSSYTGLRKTSGTSVEVLMDEGTIGFTATSGGGWKPEDGAEQLTLTGQLTGTFTLTDDDGATTVFKKVDPAADTWQVESTKLPTDNTTTRVVSEKVPVGPKVLARPKYLIAPSTAATSDACASAPATAGCESLEFVYATATTATGYTTAADFGDFAGQVKEIRRWATAPGATAATSQAVSTYRYDKDGRLRQQWDPRLSQATQVQYSYDTGNRVYWMMPGTELPWTFTYGKAGTSPAAGDGMLLKASRPSLAQGSKTVTDGGSITNSVVYNVPLTGANAPYKLGAADIAAWGQTDAPTDATAVFPPDSVPAGNDGSALTATAYKRAAVTYVNASGREVNTAQPGGHISTTGYNADGAVVYTLSAANRELALATSGPALDRLADLGIADAGTAERAALLAETKEYSADGLRLLHSYGPLHQVELEQGAADLPAGSEVPARLHTATAYDEGRPADAAVSGQPTTVTTGAFVPGRAGGDLDTRTSTTTYDWAKGLPLKAAEDPAGLNLVTSTAYDAQGRVVSTTLPKGGTAATRVTSYYTAAGTGTCGGRPEWADKVCSEGPADPAAGTTSVYEYDAHGEISKTTEKAGSEVRVTQVTRDDAGRVTRTAVTGGLGTAVPETVRTYDPVNGKLTSVTAGGKTAAYGYDALGRQVSYDDGAGNVTTTEYDPLGRMVKVADSAPSTVTYAYDTAKEPRGLPTSLTDSVAGTFGATYDASGEVANETLPGGYTLRTVTDETGFTTSRAYTRDADGASLLTDVAVPTVYGQTGSGARSAGASTGQSFRYDRTGRLTDVDESGAYGQQHRTYGFDADSNRTRLVSTRDQDGAPASTTTDYTYDASDRLTGTGISYDAFGRTLTKPDTVFGYYANDLVRQQTSGGHRQTWNLDAQGRLGSWTAETLDAQGAVTASVNSVNHYRDASDNPTWTVEDVAANLRSRNVTGLSGELAAVTGTAGDTVLQFTDLHGDAGVALPLDPQKPLSVADTDEYGNVREGTASARYNWLAAQQRDSGTPAGVVLMGARQYDPSTGRFLSVDPVYGGNANPYEYCSGDGVNCTDLTGQYGANKWGCGAFVDYPHPSHTVHGRINVHADLKCKKKVPSFSIHITLYRSRWYGWEKMDTGYESGSNKYKARAVANWAPHGHCYYYKGVGDFMIASGPHGSGHRIYGTVYNYDKHYLQGKSEMCV
ncbi:DNRLRE domain-containing protein [Streptomyces sp. NPDC051578]|uniref:DNRLRE domain-containing protein n=1 Tax=Streptomyces sp. NPDC051578 TaxID=3365662 RepID=UPI00378CBDE3